VQSATQEIHEHALEHQQRELRQQIAEAERQGDDAALAALSQKKMELDRTLRDLRRSNGQ